MRSSQPSQLASRNATPKPSRCRLGAASPTAVVWSAKSPCPRLWKSEVELTVKIRNGQVEAAVAVEITAGHTHPRLVASTGVGRDARRMPDFLEPEPTQVAEQEVCRAVIGHEQVDPPVLVQVGGHDAEAPSVAVNDSRVGRDVDESARRRCGKRGRGATRSSGDRR